MSEITRSLEHTNNFHTVITIWVLVDGQLGHFDNN